MKGLDKPYKTSVHDMYIFVETLFKQKTHHTTENTYNALQPYPASCLPGGPVSVGGGTPGKAAANWGDVLHMSGGISDDVRFRAFRALGLGFGAQLRLRV